MATLILPQPRPVPLARWSALALALCLLTWVSSAAAYHTEEDHITDDTAWTLTGDKAFRVGLYKASATIADRLDIGTYVWPWVLRTPNAFAKLRFLSLGPSQWAVEAGVIRLDTATIDRSVQDPPVFTVGAVAVVSSIEFGSRAAACTSMLVYSSGLVVNDASPSTT